MAKTYVYVVDRDFGFAPNPFHGICTLSTCKPRIRGPAKVGDWVVGMGGTKLKATGRCIFFMQVSGALSFNEYWSHPDFLCKRPKRNGSRKVMLGDNIYHRDDEADPWTQEDSHHSNPDGSRDPWNVDADTSRDRMLYSRRFVYFGSAALVVPQGILDEIGYENRRDHRTFEEWQSAPLTAWMEKEGAGRWNTVVADPFQFEQSGARYSKQKNRVVA